MIGQYPTPVERLDKLGLWVKRDDLTSPVYGGNKVRKLERLIPDAIERGKKRIVTVGAVGSHHVLATAVFGARAGLGVEAAIVPQRRTEHVERNVRADLAAGATLRPARTYVGAGISALLHGGRDAYLVPMGGSNVVGSLGYVDAAFELAKQIETGLLPEPDAIVVTLGSGGTAAGLTAGVALAGMKTIVIGVVVASPVWFVTGWTRRLVRRVYAAAGGRDPRALEGRLQIVTSELGRGYGEPTDSARRALEIGRENGLSLDLTYTAKCFAGALAYVQNTPNSNVLYWHTLSSAPLDELLENAPPLPRAVERLLRG
ncbi:MAG TPA: pyridoxal-phosphate dependent enzyme [Polyangiaceae bacterium]|jgi:1-aminocyclopropane-1-carboxylate deaminase/D-cysteine desulfhydrase-like pyridoxal-dependent ACC family enzyme